MAAPRLLRRFGQYLGVVADHRDLSPSAGAAAHRRHPEAQDLVVIVVFVPEGEAAEAVRAAAAQAGAGAIGDYRACSFSVTGEGRFEPTAGARPAIGRIGAAETVQEQRIEVVCPRWLAAVALRAMLAAHPYEEPAHHVYSTLRPEDL